jgi:hypothetical protein
VGYYLEEMGIIPYYIDPLTDPDSVPVSVQGCVLLAHNQQITYGYAGVNQEQNLYCEISDGSIVIDPWRKYSTSNPNIKVIHYGNTRGN